MTKIKNPTGLGPVILFVLIYLALAIWFGVNVQAQHHTVSHKGATLHTYTIPMLADTVVVITNPGLNESHVEHDFYNEHGKLIEWHSGSGWLQPHATKALWRCYSYSVEWAAWGSLVVTSTRPIAIKAYMDLEIAQGYGCP